MLQAAFEALMGESQESPARNVPFRRGMPRPHSTYKRDPYEGRDLIILVRVHFFSFHIFLFVCCLCTWILKGNIANPGLMKKSSIFVFSFTMFRNHSIPFDFFDLGIRESEGSDYWNTFLIELRVLVRWAN